MTVPRETVEYLAKELDAATRQIQFYKQHKPNSPFPKGLAGRVEFLRGYLKCIKHVQNLDREGGLEDVVNRLKISTPGFFTKRQLSPKANG